MIFALTNAISDLAGKLGEWRRQQQAYAELSALDDRTLADIGLNRGDLDRMFDDRFNWDLRERAPLSF